MQKTLQIPRVFLLKRLFQTPGKQKIETVQHFCRLERRKCCTVPISWDSGKPHSHFADTHTHIAIRTKSVTPETNHQILVVHFWHLHVHIDRCKKEEKIGTVPNGVKHPPPRRTSKPNTPQDAPLVAYIIPHTGANKPGKVASTVGTQMGFKHFFGYNKARFEDLVPASIYIYICYPPPSPPHAPTFSAAF